MKFDYYIHNFVSFLENLVMSVSTDNFVLKANNNLATVNYDNWNY